MCRRSLLQRWLVRALALILLPTLPGCLIPYGFPKIDQTPLLCLGEETEEVHAFRIDVTRDFVDIGGSDQCTLSEVTFLPGRWVPPQTKISATYGHYVFGIALNYPVYTSHSLGLELYRPGYELVELDSWQFSREIVWKKADDLRAQEQALDRLFLMTAEDRANKPASVNVLGRRLQYWGMISAQLSPGSESTDHRRVLLFGASEYERLRSSAKASGDEGEAVRCRLESKAQDLRKLAGETEPSSSFGRLWRHE
jgi:hypothetical protein